MSRPLPLLGEKPPPSKQRPKCPWCGRALKANYSLANAQGVKWGEPPYTQRVWTGYQGELPFCSQTCAITWAKAAWVMSGSEEASRISLAWLHKQVPLDPDVSGQTRKEKR